MHFVASGHTDVGLMREANEDAFLILARPEGLEPPTRCLEGSRSVQLSYGRIRSLL